MRQVELKKPAPRLSRHGERVNALMASVKREKCTTQRISTFPQLTGSVGKVAPTATKIVAAVRPTATTCRDSFPWRKRPYAAVKMNRTAQARISSPVDNGVLLSNGVRSVLPAGTLLHVMLPKEVSGQAADGAGDCVANCPSQCPLGGRGGD